MKSVFIFWSYRYLIGITLLVAMVFSSCESSGDEKNDDYILEKIRIGASLRETGHSRAYQEDGPIVEGLYNFTFLNSNHAYETGVVSFEESIGFASRMLNSKLTDLRWRDIAPDEDYGNTYSFYMDNLPGEYDMFLTAVELDEEVQKQYSAALFDNVEGSNDLIWGSLEKVERAPLLSFNLNHVMARFCLRVYFDNSKGFENVYPTHAGISNLFTTPISFDRLTGTLGLKDLPDESVFTLVEQKGDWKEGYDESNEMIYFESPDFIIPPQEFLSNMRPRLTVEVATDNGNSYPYSGLFPIVMDLVGEDGIVTPWMMCFLRGYKLTMNVKISNSPPQLQFMPVTILDWLKKGEYNITGKQASLEKDEDFDELISAYNDKKTDLFYKWGYQDKVGKWLFNIFINMDLTASKYKECMKYNGISYGFNLHDIGVNVKTEAGDVELKGTDGAQKLYDLFNEGKIPANESAN